MIFHCSFNSYGVHIKVTGKKQSLFCSSLSQLMISRQTRKIFSAFIPNHKPNGRRGGRGSFAWPICWGPQLFYPCYKPANLAVLKAGWPHFPQPIFLAYRHPASDPSDIKPDPAPFLFLQKLWFILLLYSFFSFSQFASSWTVTFSSVNESKFCYVLNIMTSRKLVQSNFIKNNASMWSFLF